MKVAIVSTIQPETHYTRYLYRELSKLNPDTYLYIDDTDENKRYIKDQKNKHIVIAWKTGLSLPLRLPKEINKRKIKIVHLQHEFNMYGGIIGVPGFLVTCVVLRLMKVKIITTIHAVVGKDQINEEFLKTMALDRYKNLLPLLKLAFTGFYYFLGRISNSFIVHSNFSGNLLINDYKYDSSKVNVIPIGVEKPVKLDETDVRKEIKDLSKNKNILFFGYLLRRKGIELLLNAFSKINKKYPEYRIVLAGGFLDNQKNYVEELKRMSKKMNMTDKVIFTGFLSESEIDSVYRNCEFVVLPYTHSISSSLPLSFAFQYGKPVIGSDIGTLEEEIKEDVDGLIFKSGSTTDLQRKITNLIDNKNTLKQLSVGATNEGRIRSWDSVAKNTLAIYKNTI